jgi:rhodanese-related sulfurtransferase
VLFAYHQKLKKPDMNKLFSIIAIVAFAMFSCEATGQNISLVGPAEFEEVLNSDQEYQLIDVRTPSEFNRGFIDGATLIDFMQPNFQTEMAKLDKSKPVLLYCAVGGRSGKAAKMLSNMGFENVYDLKGGIRAWSNSKKKLVRK